MLKTVTVGVFGGIVMVLGFFVVFVMPTFADESSGDHDVNVIALDELILGGSSTVNVTLNPTISANDSKAAGALSIQATKNWKLEWRAVTGNVSAQSIVGATGTNLGTAGFTNSGGYAYAGSQTAATVGTNTWGVILAVTGGSLAPTPTLSTSLSVAVTGGPTVVATLTPTFSAGTNGALGVTTYYGTIYFVLSASAAP